MSSNPLARNLRTVKWTVLAVLMGGAWCAERGDAQQLDQLRGTWGYVLQAEKLADRPQQAVQLLANSKRDVLVLDCWFEPGRIWTPEQLELIRRGKPGRVLLAYLSIGEAEEYRPYWNPPWKKHPPEFLGPENPHWPGNHIVHYWHPQWQNIILAEVERAMRLGFDGLYLDKVDAYLFFQKERQADPGHHQAKRTPRRGFQEEMVEWVRRIAARARRILPRALIVPQNAEELLRWKVYRQLINAQAVEDLFCDGQRRQKVDEIRYRLQLLRLAQADGKPVVCVEYCSQPSLRNWVKQQARKYRFSLLFTDRELGHLGEALGQ